MTIEEIAAEVESTTPAIRKVMAEVGRVIIGQEYLIERLLMGLIADGHILVEGVPGLAKTTAVKALARAVKATFMRVQFTPDLLPADILGTQIYNPKTGEFTVKKGPLFHNIILADEINRAPAKVQSALLEAMQEKQITIGDTTYTLDEPFIVMATQNPIEQEGTYPLPEAQVDRFMMKLNVTYPKRDEELLIMDRVANKKSGTPGAVLTPDDLVRLRSLVRGIHVDPKINEYIVNLVFATRHPAGVKQGGQRTIQYGASPRASIALNILAKAHAVMKGRAYVVPQDVKTMAPDVLRHRLILTYEAEAEGLSTDEVLMRLLEQIEVP